MSGHEGEGNWLSRGSERVRQDPCLVGLKRKCWDPISTAVTLVLVVFGYSSIHSFAGHSLYQGGMRSAGDQWGKLPIVNMVWAPKDCPKDHQPLKAVDSLFREIKNPRPAYGSTQGRLCIQRAGLPSDIPGDEPRPRAHCTAADGLKQCMEGKFPYCGKVDVPCPLVDVSDFVPPEDIKIHVESRGNDPNRVANMRTHCNTSIPSAYLPWTGCRPIMDMLISTSHPCFKYSTNGWGARSWNSRKRAELGPNEKKCVRRDSRYRLMQVYPFLTNMDGVVSEKHDGPSTGIYYRHELFYNPECKEPQDLFTNGYLYVDKMSTLAKYTVVLVMLLALFVGITFTICTRKHRLQSIAVEYVGDRWDKIMIIAGIGRLGVGVCSLWCSWKALNMQRYFAPLTSDKTCIDPLLYEVTLEFVRESPHITLLFLSTAGIIFVQLVLDVVITPFWIDDEEQPEAAPLFRPLPAEPDDVKSRREHIKYVWADRSKWYQEK